ncbi:claudin-34-like [Chiloscyllium punctatum]|uniref:claudin-34-like n=1 Tax=Chiloscyllium punctatum TaxID=137246 RepID=UPI003B635AC4
MGHHGSRVALQLVGLVLGTVGWIGSAIATGLIQWRVWRVSSPEITSGVAWVGIWRVCLYSRPLATPPFQGMSCRRLGALDSFVPSEIGVGQGMMLAAVVLGALGKVATVYGLWDAYIGEGCQSRRAGLAFTVGGGFHLLASLCVLVPAAWNLNSVLSNRTIAFPPHYHLPPSARSQEPGAALYVAFFSSALLSLTAAFLLSYRTSAWPSSPRVHPLADDFSDCSSLVSRVTPGRGASLCAMSVSEHSLSSYGADNPAFTPDSNSSGLLRSPESTR